MIFSNLALILVMISKNLTLDLQHVPKILITSLSAFPVCFNRKANIYLYISDFFEPLKSSELSSVGLRGVTEKWGQTEVL